MKITPPTDKHPVKCSYICRHLNGEHLKTLVDEAVTKCCFEGAT